MVSGLEGFLIIVLLCSSFLCFIAFLLLLSLVSSVPIPITSDVTPSPSSQVVRLQSLLVTTETVYISTRGVMVIMTVETTVMRLTVKILIVFYTRCI